VKLARLELEPVAWRLRAPLRTARGELAERAGVRLRASDTDGCRGLGEALPLPGSGTESLPQTCAALERAARRLEGASGELDELLDALDALCPDEPAARCALDVALHDLAARRAEIRAANLLAPHPLHRLPVNALLGSLDRRAVEDARRRGFTTLKFKLGAQPLERELEALSGLLRAEARGLRVRVDPNGAWTREQARAALAHPAVAALELVEQPVAAEDLDGLRELARGPVPLAADEALARADGRAALIAGELAPIAVLKPMVLGGLRAAARLARAARPAGVRCLVTTTLDGPIASAAAAQLAAAVCDGSLACGLAAAESIAADFPAWLEPRAGAIDLPALPGLGLGDSA
jgi:L-alanine-DL-glutamate epimerase-like enolase superfamily enzyme